MLTSKHTPNQRIQRVFFQATLTGAILGGFGLYGCWRCGSVQHAIAFMQGQRVLLDAQNIQLGKVDPGQGVEAVFKLTNLSSEPVTIITAQQSCACTIVDGLPVVIEPRTTKAVSLEVEAPRNPGQSSGTTKLYTDDPHNKEVKLSYQGTVASSL